MHELEPKVHAHMCLLHGRHVVCSNLDPSPGRNIETLDPFLAGHDPHVTTWVYPINWVKFDTAFGGYGQSFSGNPQVRLAYAWPWCETRIRSWSNYHVTYCPAQTWAASSLMGPGRSLLSRYYF